MLLVIAIISLIMGIYLMFWGKKKKEGTREEIIIGLLGMLLIFSGLFLMYSMYVGDVSMTLFS